MQPDQAHEELREDALEILRAKLGDRLIPFLHEVLRFESGDEWKLQRLDEDRREILELLDRLERRVALEIELHTRPDGMVDVDAVREELLAWDPEEDDDG